MDNNMINSPDVAGVVEDPTTPPTGGSGADPITEDQWKQLKKKYAGSLPQIKEDGTKIGALDHRMQWVGWANQKLPTSGTPAELSKKAAQATGFNKPGLLLASSMEEGVGNRFKGDEAYSPAYDNAKIDKNKFPVDGFYSYGLDQIGAKADEFIQKGYLPKDFKNNMQTFRAANEPDEVAYHEKLYNLAVKNKLVDPSIKAKYTKNGVLDKQSYFDALDDATKDYKGQLPVLAKSAYTAAFKDDASAFLAKAAFMKSEQDNINTYSKQKGYNLTPEEQNFFTLAAYNGGTSNGQQMLDYYANKKLLGNNGFLKDRMSAKGQIYDNVMPRYAGANLFNGEHYFKNGGRMKYGDGTPDPITSKKPQLKNNGQPSFFDSDDQEFPSRPQAPGDLMLVDNTGQPVNKAQQAPIVPLSQFYDKALDTHGNVVLNGTGKYTNAMGGINTVANEQTEEDGVSAENKAHAEHAINALDNIEAPATLGIAAINSFFTKVNGDKENRMTIRKDLLTKIQNAGTVNPYLEGTGSQAIMKYGGKMKFGDGGSLEGPGDPAVRKLSPQEQNEWNSFIDFVNKKGLSGSKDLDNRDKRLGQKLFDQFKQANPNVSINYDIVPSAQNEFQEFQKTIKDKVQRKTQFDNISKVDGWFGSVTSQQKFIPLEEENSDGTVTNKGLMNGKGVPTADRKLATGGEVGKGINLNILDGGSYKQISDSDHSNPMIEFTGREHKDGGIGLEFGGNQAEVENKEVGWVDGNGGLNVFGKLKFPGTNQTFRAVAKDVAEEEQKVDKTKSKYLAILNGADEADPYQNSAMSTAKVMFKSLDNKAKEIAKKKEGLASFQSLILNMADKAGTDNSPKEFGGKMNRADFPKAEVGMTLDPTDPDTVAKLIKALGQYEGSNKYDVQGKVISKGMYKGERALGKYQIMPGNLKVWSKEALGKEVTPEEFLKSPDIQEKIAAHRINEIAKTYNDPKDIASVWFSGRPYKGNSASDGYNSVPQYVDNVMKIYNGGSPSTSSNTKASVKPTTAVASNDVKPNVGGTVNSPVGINNNVATPLSDKEKEQANNSIYGSAYKRVNPLSDNTVSISPADPIRGQLSPLAMAQIAPELLSIAGNKRQPVESQSYNPDLKQTFDMSYQLGRNENESSFKQLAAIAQSTGNMDALGQMEAQKYQADQQYNMQEVQGNATQKLQTYNANTDVLNDAQLKNIALRQDQQVKQASADFNTKRQDLDAFSSIAAKTQQNKLENTTYNAYAELFKHYGFDKNGNVTFNPDNVTQRFNAGEAQHFGMLAAQKGASDFLNSVGNKTTTKYDKDGNVKQTAITDDDLEQFSKIIKLDIPDEKKQRMLQGNSYGQKYFNQ